MNDLFHAFQSFSGIVGTIQGIIVIISFILSIVWKSNPIEMKEDNRLGKVLSVLSIILSFFVFFLYYKIVKPISYINNFQLDIVYIVLGGFVILFIAAIATIISYFLLMYIYKIIENNGDWFDFTDLQITNSTIGLIRLILNPLIIFFLIYSNYLTSTMLFRCGFGKIQWLIGPFLPIALLIIFLLIKDHYENSY